MPDIAPRADHRARAVAIRRVQQLEIFATPQAFMDEVTLVEGSGDPDLMAAIADSVATADLRAQTALVQYRTETLDKCATLYRGKATGRNLLVGFAGRSQRLMLPAAMLLQRLPEDGWDMLILRDPTGQHYRLGAGDLAMGFPQLAKWVMGMAAPYARVVTIGTSMGALAAARLALIVPGVRAISVGARPALDIGRLFRPTRLPPAYDQVCACLPKAARDILFVHSEGHDEDARWAALSAAHCGGRSIAVKGAETHGAIHELWQMGKLGKFLAAVLAEAPMDDVIAAVRVVTGDQES